MSHLVLTNNVPDTYVRQSRDFQLLCRAYDLLNNATLYDISTIINSISTEHCPSKLIELLQTKLGFFTEAVYDTDVMRKLLEAFPYIMKYKGSKKGLDYALNTFVKANNIIDVPEISIDNDTYEIILKVSRQITELDLLRELITYIIPTGYIVIIDYKQSNVYDGGVI